MNLEVRKTRLDLVWKILAVCVPVLGAMIAYFGQTIIKIPTTGEMLFIGVEALCTLLLLNGIRYIYKESAALQDDNDEKYQRESEGITTAYNNIFYSVKANIIYTSVHMICLSIYSLKNIEWMQCFIPTQTHLFIALVVSVIFLLIPSNRIWEFSTTTSTQTYDVNVNASQDIMPRKSIKIETNKLKALRWAFYSAFWFDLWYILTLTLGNTPAN